MLLLPVEASPPCRRIAYFPRALTRASSDCAGDHRVAPRRRCAGVDGYCRFRDAAPPLIPSTMVHPRTSPSPRPRPAARRRGAYSQSLKMAIMPMATDASAWRRPRNSSAGRNGAIFFMAPPHVDESAMLATASALRMWNAHFDGGAARLARGDRRPRCDDERPNEQQRQLPSLPPSHPRTSHSDQHPVRDPHAHDQEQAQAFGRAPCSMPPCHSGRRRTGRCARCRDHLQQPERRLRTRQCAQAATVALHQVERDRSCPLVNGHPIFPRLRSSKIPHPRVQWSWPRPA